MEEYDSQEEHNYKVLSYLQAIDSSVSSIAFIFKVFNFFLFSFLILLGLGFFVLPIVGGI